MKIPVIDDVPDGWSYDSDNSEDDYRQYDCVASEFGTMTYTSITGVDGEYYVTGCLMGRDKVEESFNNPEDANQRAIEFMEENIY